jgi:hypothetical protein
LNLWEGRRQGGKERSIVEGEKGRRRDGEKETRINGVRKESGRRSRVEREKEELGIYVHI